MVAGLSTNPAALETFKGMANTQAQSKSSAALKDAVSSGDKKRIDAAAEDFEAVFITEMLKPMFSLVEVDDTFGGGKGEEVFRDFMVNEYGKMIAKQGGIGLSAQIKNELIKMQGGQMPSAPAPVSSPTADAA
jgi:Rod binding domain-containing protein